VSGLDQLQYLSWIVYIVIFVAVLRQTLRRPTPAHVDMTLFFGAAVLLIVINVLTQRLRIVAPMWLGDVQGGTAIALGYLLLRLVRDFSPVPKILIRVAEAAVVAAVVALAVLPSPIPPLAALLFVAYLVAVIGYSVVAFYRYSKRTRGVTRRRIQAAALGSLCFVMVLVFQGLGLLMPALTGTIQELSAATVLGSAVCYFVAFAPPTWLRRAWQEPELRAFMARVTSLSRLGELRAIAHELERAAADALGAPMASVAIWDPDAQCLHVFGADSPTLDASHAEAADTLALSLDWEMDPASQPVAARAFNEQRANLLIEPRERGGGMDVFKLYAAEAVLSAPISAFGRRLGALHIYAQRAPMFADSDLELVQLLADMAAVVLESRALIDEETSVRAREEAARLKEDFLSSAAHDLKTPLTGIVTQSQVLMRRVDRDPKAPADRAGLERLLQQSLRLRDLVLELLDVSRLEQGGLIGERSATDLGDLLVTARTREGAHWDRVRLLIDEPVIVPIDVARFGQVATNLIENALKYSPHDAPVEVHVFRRGNEARMSVVDRGIGVPLEDQALIFERFHRARNVDDRRYAGMGLGLYIARGIVAEHGGRIWVESSPGSGSTFCVALPLTVAAAA
jgi:signal transduction histidine kinase